MRLWHTVLERHTLVIIDISIWGMGVVSGRSRIGNNVQEDRYGGDKIDKKKREESRNVTRKKKEKKRQRMAGAQTKKPCREWRDKEGEYLHKHVTREREGRDRDIYGGRRGDVVNFQHRKNARTTGPKRQYR